MPGPFRSLLISGRDRVRFLHNFCTADIRGLSAGHATEAFFTDARGRILAHGYVLMLDQQLQVWLLADDPQRLQKHLERYIISEDVILSVPAIADSIAVSTTGLPSLPGLPTVTPGLCGPVTDIPGQATALCVAWSGQPVCIFCGDADTLATLRHAPELQPRLLSDAELSQLRIAERFPMIGVDLSIEHLAPEAGRNAQAISFTKGCYLGQEPIARIDAIGHVNRSLKRVRLTGLATPASETGIEPPGSSATAAATAAVGAELLLADGTSAGTITSAAVTADEASGLAVLRLASLSQITHARTTDGRLLPVTLTEG
ncbi:MAG: YgfZ/GcvT domain-containing protein [Planctomycetota bacterium]